MNDLIFTFVAIAAIMAGFAGTLWLRRRARRSGLRTGLRDPLGAARELNLIGAAMRGRPGRVLAAYQSGIDRAQSTLAVTHHGGSTSPPAVFTVHRGQAALITVSTDGSAEAILLGE